MTRPGAAHGQNDGYKRVTNAHVSFRRRRWKHAVVLGEVYAQRSEKNVGSARCLRFAEVWTNRGELCQNPPDTVDKA